LNIDVLTNENKLFLPLLSATTVRGVRIGEDFRPELIQISLVMVNN